MEEYEFVYILPVTVYFSEGDEHPSAWSLTKRLLPIDCLGVQAIASNRLPVYPSDCFMSQTK